MMMMMKSTKKNLFPISSTSWFDWLVVFKRSNSFLKFMNIKNCSNFYQLLRVGIILHFNDSIIEYCEDKLEEVPIIPK